MDKHQKTLAALAILPPDERREARKALLSLSGRGPVARARALEAAEDIILARARTIHRAASDKVTDKKRRMLVGARVPKADAARYRRCALEDGVSMYAWVVAALDAAAEAQEIIRAVSARPGPRPH